MNAWKVGGELHCPKNMTRGSYRPKGVVKAAFHSSPSLMQMLLYPHRVAHAPPAMVLFFLFLFLPLTFAFMLMAVAVLCKPGCAVRAADTSSV